MRTGRPLLTWLALSSWLLASSAGAQFAAVTPPFQVDHLVNEGSQNHGTVAMLRDGRFCIVWNSNAASLMRDDGLNVRARLFDADGTPLTDEFLVSPDSALDQNTPSVATDGGQRFIIAWNEGDDATGYRPHYRLLDISGQFISEPLAVGEPSSQENFPSAGMAPDGTFLIVWSEFTDDAQHQWAAGFDAVGGPLWEPRRLNSLAGNTVDLFGLPEVDVSRGGWVVAVWSYANAEAGSAICFTEFDIATGPVPGKREQLTAASSRIQARSQRPAVSLNAVGEFVISWVVRIENRADRVYAQAFDRFAQAKMAPIEVAPEFDRNKERATVQLFADGSFAVFHALEGRPPDPWDLVVTLFDQTGKAIQGPAVLTSDRQSIQTRPAVAISQGRGQGLMAVTWESPGAQLAGSEKSIAARLFRFRIPWTR